MASLHFQVLRGYHSDSVAEGITNCYDNKTYTFTISRTNKWTKRNHSCQYGLFYQVDGIVLIFKLVHRTGQIPSEIGLLSRLTNLDLNTSVLNGTIPTEVGYLTGLPTLYLYNNSLTGPMPSEIGLLTSLTVLDLDSNSLTGTIPTQLGQLQSLQYLSKSWCYLPE